MAAEQIRVVLFSGGSGTRTITEHFARHPQISLTILINCYDDGHSTGRLRKFIPGMLGPSDVRKNINNLMPTGERFQDPTSGELIEVWEDPVRGEREYRPVKRQSQGN